MSIEEAWLAYCKAHGMDSMNRNTYATFRAGWEAALKRVREIVYPNQDTGK